MACACGAGQTRCGPARTVCSLGIWIEGNGRSCFQGRLWVRRNQGCAPQRTAGRPCRRHRPADQPRGKPMPGNDPLFFPCRLSKNWDYDEKRLHNLRDNLMIFDCSATVVAAISSSCCCTVVSPAKLWITSNPFFMRWKLVDGERMPAYQKSKHDNANSKNEK